MCFSRTFIRLSCAATLTMLALAGMGCDTQTEGTAHGWFPPEEMYERALNLEALGLDGMAHSWLLKAAEAGHPIAQVEVGFWYRYGNAGFLRNPDEARKWYLRVARERVPMAFADFMTRSRSAGLETEQNLQEAERWFRRGVAACQAAARRGDMNAQTLLGGLYGAGAGVARDRARALQLWSNAAQRGYAPAQLILGRLYWHEGAYEEARQWLKAAAEHDLSEAEYLLSDLYQFGHGVPADRAEAMRWLRLSADHGYAVAQRQIRSMEAQGLL